MSVKRQRVMWDFFCGFKGASEAFRARGWKVITVDNNPIFRPDILADVCDLRLRGEDAPDFAWFSPVCTDFALRRFDKSLVPSMNLVIQSARLERDLRPKLFAVENVKNSVPYISSVFGPHRLVAGPFFLFGNFPMFIPRPVPSKGSPRGPHWLRSAERARVPLSLSEDMEAAVSYFLDQQESAHVRAQAPRIRAAQEPEDRRVQEPATRPTRAPEQNPVPGPEAGSAQEPGCRRVQVPVLEAAQVPGFLQ